jgi:hypothetical protein
MGLLLPRPRRARCAGGTGSECLKDRTRLAQRSRSRDAASPRVCFRGGASRAVPDDTDGRVATRRANPSAGACVDGHVDSDSCRYASRDGACAGFQSAVRRMVLSTSILAELPLSLEPKASKPPARRSEAVSCATPLDHVRGNSANDSVVPDRGGAYRRMRVELVRSTTLRLRQMRAGWYGSRQRQDAIGTRFGDNRFSPTL